MSKQIKLLLTSRAHRLAIKAPEYATPGSAGMDLRACISRPIVIEPLERKAVPTGLMIELPLGVEAQIRPRSGLSYMRGITVLNSPGTIDSDYRGEIQVILINLEPISSFTINTGDRIAQMVITNYETAEFNVVDGLSETQRQDGGLGSTGIN